MTDKYKRGADGQLYVKHLGTVGDTKLEDISCSRCDWDRVTLSESINNQFQSQIFLEIAPRSNAFIDRSSIYLEVFGQVVDTTQSPITKLRPDAINSNIPAVSLANGFSDCIFNSITTSVNGTDIGDRSGRYAHYNSFCRKLLNRSREDFKSCPITTPMIQYDVVTSTDTNGLNTQNITTNAMFAKSDPAMSGSEFYYMSDPPCIDDARIPMSTCFKIDALVNYADVQAQAFNLGIAGNAVNLSLAGTPASVCPDNLNSTFNRTVNNLTAQIVGPNNGQGTYFTSQNFNTIVRIGDGFFESDQLESTWLPPGSRVQLRLQQAPDALRLQTSALNQLTLSANYQYQITSINLWYQYMEPTIETLAYFNQTFVDRPFYHNIMRSIVYVDNIPNGTSEYNRQNIYNGVRPYLVTVMLPTSTSANGALNEQWTSIGPYSKPTQNIIPTVRNIYVTWNNPITGVEQHPKQMYNTPQNNVVVSSAVPSPMQNLVQCDPTLMTRQYMGYVKACKHGSLLSCIPPSLTFEQWSQYYTVFCFKLYTDTSEKFAESKQDMTLGALGVYISFDQPIGTYANKIADSTGYIGVPQQGSIANQAQVLSDLGQKNSALTPVISVYGHTELKFIADSSNALVARTQVDGFA